MPNIHASDAQVLKYANNKYIDLINYVQANFATQ